MYNVHVPSSAKFFFYSLEMGYYINLLINMLLLQ